MIRYETQQSRLYKIIKGAFLIIIVLRCIYLIVIHLPQLTEPTSLTKLHQAYQKSQYVNPNSSTWIDDPELYTYAGIRYIQGYDPSIVNFELQPLTKYLFGLSTFLFGNPLAVQFITFIGLTVIVFRQSRRMTTSDIYPFLTLLLILFDPLISSHLHKVYLDLTQAFLIQIYLYVLYKSLIQTNHQSFLGMLLGLIALSKTFVVGILIFFITVLAWIVFHKSVFSLIRVCIYSILTYLLGYIIFFVYHPHVFDFVQLHIKILKLYRSYVPEYPKAEVFRILLTGRWQTWYGDFALKSVPEWTLIWPLSLGMTLVLATESTIQVFRNITPYKSLSQTLNQLRKYLATLSSNYILVYIHLVWIIAYLIMISLRLVFPRYLIPVLPSLYLVAVFYVSRFIQFRVQNSRMINYLHGR